MSISNSLSNATSGMAAASRLAEIVSSNVSNALTDGYGRRSLNLSAASVGGNGAGVEIGSVNRHVDRGILADRRLADARLGEHASLAKTLNRVQDIVGGPGDGFSISGRIASLEAAVVGAANDPSSTTRLNALAGRFTDLTDSLNAASKSIQTERVRADLSIADQVDQLNTSLSQVEQLNSDIVSARVAGVDASGLLDQRQQIVDAIAQIVPVRELDRGNGRIALFTSAGETLIDGRAKQFGFVHNGVITPDMTREGGGLSGLTQDGVSIATDGIGKLAGGTLGAAFTARDAELVDAQSGLDDIAVDLINRFQDLSIDPTLMIGQPGLMTDAGTQFDPADTVGIAGRIAVNAAVIPDAGGTVTKLRDGLYAATPGPTGNSTLLSSISAALSAPRVNEIGTPAQSLAGRTARIEADIGDRRNTYEAEVSFESARWSTLREAEAAGGVDTDYEMQTLLRIEQSYAANARVIQVVDSMMQRLMEI